MKTHYFIALKIPHHEKKLLYHFIEKRKADYSFKNWVHPEDYHITLAFLGNASKEELDEVIRGVHDILQHEKSFPLTVRKLGIFGQKTRPRVFWADVYPSEPLMQVRNKVFDVCEKIGFVLDKRPFRPHITLARRWVGDASFSEKLLLPVTLGEGQSLSFSVEEIVLYRTNPQRTPKYEEIHIFPLGD